MKDKRFFLDTNVLIYSLDTHTQKKKIALELLLKYPVISTQVINELSNILHRKFKFSYSRIANITKKYLLTSSLLNITNETIHLAYHIGEKYKYTYYDSLIIASALENNCEILYSEDLHNGQILENQLKIINPFLK